MSAFQAHLPVSTSSVLATCQGPVCSADSQGKGRSYQCCNALDMVIVLQVPEVEGSEVLQGQVLAVEVAGLTDGVGAFKARLAEVRSRQHNHGHGPGRASPLLDTFMMPCFQAHV